MHDGPVPAKPAQPDRYLVDRIGTPDPESTEYYVLDIVNDVDARVALAFLGNSYRKRNQEGRAEACSKALRDTNEAHRLVIESRNPKQKGRKQKGAA